MKKTGSLVCRMQLNYHRLCLTACNAIGNHIISLRLHKNKPLNSPALYFLNGRCSKHISASLRLGCRGHAA